MSRLFLSDYLKLVQSREQLTVGNTDVALSTNREANEILEKVDTAISERRQELAETGKTRLNIARQESVKKLADLELQLNFKLKESTTASDLAISKLRNEVTQNMETLCNEAFRKIVS
jgi:hypothetical protein